jgi:heterotetrameric sarcosine oxidase gamma subunit
VADPDPSVPFRVTELAGWSLVQLAFWPDALSAIGEVMTRLHGIATPMRIGETTGDGRIHALRLAPGRIWIVAEAGASATPLARALRDHVSLTTLTHGQRRYRVCGVQLRRLLGQGIAIDLDGPMLAPGRVAQTQLERVPVLLHRLDREALNLHVPGSFARWLEDGIAAAVS